MPSWYNSESRDTLNVTLAVMIVTQLVHTCCWLLHVCFSERDLNEDLINPSDEVVDSAAYKWKREYEIGVFLDWCSVQIDLDECVKAILDVDDHPKYFQLQR